MSDIELKILWVTNMAPPYRLPVWESLAGSADLEVRLLESSERLSRDVRANRGADWNSHEVTGYSIKEYRTLRVERGEDRHYTLWTRDVISDLKRADVILLGGWDSPAYWQLLFLARLTRKPVVAFYESTLASQSRGGGLISRVRRAFFGAMDAVVVPGSAAAEAVVSMGVPRNRVHVGFNAVDVDSFKREGSLAKHEGHRYLYVGQLIGRKNVDSIIRAFSKISNSDDQLTIAGRGDLRQDLEGLAEELGVGKRVKFLDYVANASLPDVMREHDTLVLASHVEVWGLVVNEALAAGMQAVVTTNCGVAASVKGMPGVLLCDDDVSDLAQTMRQARDAFNGRVTNPPILAHTPARFADTFRHAFDQVISTRHGKR